jgi:integrase
MVHKRKDRPGEGYRIKLALPAPWKKNVTWQTGLHDKRRADQVEAWLRAQMIDQPAVIDGIIGEQFDLREAWIAHRRGTLPELVGKIGDPTLVDAVAAYRPVCRDRRAQTGLDQLLTLAQPKARLSWLDARTVQQLYALAESGGQRPNTVYRGLHQAVRGLVTFHKGKAAARALYSEIRAPGEDDTREVHITPDEVRAMLDRAPVERFRWLIVMAIATTADRRPLLRLRPEHVDLEAANVTIPDTKTKARWRVVRLAGPGLVAARLAVAGVAKGSPIFPWSEGQAYGLWRVCRPEGFRFKDLRHLLPSALAAAGVDRREIEALLGHRPGSTETRRYITPVGDVAALEAAADRLGLAGWQARVG